MNVLRDARTLAWACIVTALALVALLAIVVGSLSGPPAATTPVTQSAAQAKLATLSALVPQGIAAAADPTAVRAWLGDVEQTTTQALALRKGENVGIGDALVAQLTALNMAVNTARTHLTGASADPVSVRRAITARIQALTEQRPAPVRDYYPRLPAAPVSAPTPAYPTVPPLPTHTQEPS